jgi:superfamily II DNA or RNA helicase
MNRKFFKSKKPVFKNSPFKSSINNTVIPILSEQYKQSVLENSHIGKKGYTILKSSLTPEDIDILKKELLMIPQQAFGFKGNGSQEDSFPIYRENTNKIYIPRFYGIKRYGLPEKTIFQDSLSENIDIRFTKELRDYQENIVNIYLNYVKPAVSVNNPLDSNIGNGAILEVPCGRGKCLGINTPIIMFDRSIKMVQDIEVGDLLLGDDLKPRNILTLARGKEMMYKITDCSSDNYYIVNESHILSLKDLVTHIIYDISVYDYLRLDIWSQFSLYGYRIDNDKYAKIYRILVTPLGIDNYYGFEIDGNRRFVLGDYTVTHNTVMALKIVAEIKKKTLILVHKEFLMNQWIERIGEFLPSARVGKIQANTFEVEGKDIVIGMIQTMYIREFDPAVFDCFGLTIIDEVHRIGSEEFSKTLLKISTPYMLGISATVERKDGLTKLLYMFIGDKIYSEERVDQDPVVIRGIEYISNDEEFNELEVDWRGNPKISTMISKICDFGPRSDFIIRVLRDLIVESKDGQIMVLAHNRSLLKYLYDAIGYQGFATRGYYVGGMKESALKDTEEQQIVLATYAMAAEALDIKTLSILVMVTPKVDIEQSVGRILRERHSNPIVVDIIDRHDTFQNQWRKRKTFYRKCNYRIIQTDSTKYNGFGPSELSGWKIVFEPREVECTNKESDDEEKEKDKFITPEVKCLLKIPK